MGGVNMNQSKVCSSISKSRVGGKSVMVGGASRTTLTSSSRRSQLALDSKAENKLVGKGPHPIQVFDESGNDVTPQPLLTVDPALKATQSKNVFGGGESSIGTPTDLMSQASIYQAGTTSFAGPFTQSVFGTSVTKSTRSSFADDFEPEPVAVTENLFSGLGDIQTRREEVEEELTEAVLDKAVNITLSETDTIWLIDMRGVCISAESDEAAEITVKNEKYKELCKNRDGNDRYAERSMQTFNDGLKNKDIQTTKIVLQDVGSMATNWDMYDTYLEQEAKAKVIKEDLGGWSLLASAKWDDSKEWDITDEVIKAHKHFSSSLFSMWISPDDKNSSTYIMQFQQAGLGLEPPDVYLDKEEDLEEAYKKLGADIATYLSLEDEEDETETPEKDIFDAAKKRMQAVLKWEKELAKIFVPKDQLLDPVTTYHKMTLKEFADFIPKINMVKFMEAIMGEKVPETEKVVVYSPSYFKKLNDLLKDVNMRDLLDYMRWGAIKPMLKELNQADIEILLQYQKVSDGTDTEAAKWQKCVSRTGSTLGFATGALFVQEKVTPEMKEQTDAMIKHITDAFLENLKGLKWMDDETKKRAEEKAKAVIPMVGYPDWLEDPKKLDKYYEKMEITKDDSFQNNLNTMKFYTDKNLKRWKQPVDRNEWEMSPAEVNAYYTPSFNQIVFPTGVLQQPFYNFNAPPAVNYGAISVVMGHELTHGFDTQGRKCDKHGNMFDWWLNATAEAYQDKAQCVIDQYSTYKLGDLNINDKLTIGENIADNSGSTIAMQAFQAWDKDHPDEKKIAGLDFTKEQLFYIGFGRVWCDIETEESRKMRVYADVHSNPKFRVIGVVSNSEDFAKAFNCPKPSPMNPEKCTVW